MTEAAHECEPAKGRFAALLERRLSERSTWVGIGAVLTSAITMGVEYLSLPEKRWILYGIVACGILAIIVPSKGTQDV
jgi:hypothetical protein